MANEGYELTELRDRVWGVRETLMVNLRAIERNENWRYDQHLAGKHEAYQYALDEIEQALGLPY